MAATPRLDLEAWPAAGGGLLLTSNLAAYGTGRNRTAATLFLTVPSHGKPSLMAPYARLNRASRDWMTDTVADELDLDKDNLIFSLAAYQTFDLGDIDGSIMLPEWPLRGLAAVARHLLLAEAAEVMGSSMPHDPSPSAIRSFAAGASLQSLPAAVMTRCGRRIDIAPQRAYARRTDPVACS
jgi:hypothetical protein